MAETVKIGNKRSGRDDEEETKKNIPSSTKKVKASGSIDSNPLSEPYFDVSGLNFLVTGGGQGLGKEVAESLVRSGAAGLVIACRSAEKGEAAKRDALSISSTCKFEYVLADISVVEDCRNLVKKAAEELGPIHGLVNAAGCTFRGSLESTTPELFDELINTNLRGPFFITQEVVKVMKEHKTRGSIVNIASIAAHAGAPFISPYSISKAGLNTMTKVHAQELQADRIRVNSINMGWTLTENEQKVQLLERGEGWSEKADANHPFGRLLRPIDIAATVGFLLSKASVMITGTTIDQHPEFVAGSFAQGVFFQK